jgi:ankyrin repeat protein
MLCQKNDEHLNPLQIAVENGSEQITNYLLDKLSLHTYCNNPYLVHRAARKGYAAIIRSLYNVCKP